MSKPLIKNLITKPPILFPLAALFHLIFTLYAIASLYPTPLTQRDWLRPLAMLIFTVMSIGLCSMKKWIAISYVSLSIICLAFIYTAPFDSPLWIFGDSFFPFNVMLSFFILLLFKKFTQKDVA
jgi:hypothetical protein